MWFFIHIHSIIINNNIDISQQCKLYQNIYTIGIIQTQYEVKTTDLSTILELLTFFSPEKTLIRCKELRKGDPY